MSLNSLSKTLTLYASPTPPSPTIAGIPAETSVVLASLRHPYAPTIPKPLPLAPLETSRGSCRVLLLIAFLFPFLGIRVLPNRTDDGVFTSPPIETKSQCGTEMFLASFHEKVFFGSIIPPSRTTRKKNEDHFSTAFDAFTLPICYHRVG
jgi:hypothetical protein